MSYDYISDNSLAGCFAVTAVDSFNNESEYSNIKCVDNCPCYHLPNVFTPNNDGRNDHFVPIEPYRFIGKVDMKIYSRWGTLVHETEDPKIWWDGTDINNGKPVKEGVYYYVCTVCDIHLRLSPISHRNQCFLVRVRFGFLQTKVLLRICLIRVSCLR